MDNEYTSLRQIEEDFEAAKKQLYRYSKKKRKAYIEVKKKERAYDIELYYMAKRILLTDKYNKSKKNLIKFQVY